MGFLSRIRGEHRVRAQAVVGDAGAPIQNLSAHHHPDWVTVVADIGSGPQQLRSVVDLDGERWLVPGMEITIEADPGRESAVHAFEVDWESVPTIAERIAAGDETLTDPRSARVAALASMRQAERAAGTGGPLAFAMGAPPATSSNGPALDTSDWSPEFDAALAAAADATAPEGRRRAVVIVVAIRLVVEGMSTTLDGRPITTGDGSGPQRALRGNQAVLAVSVPGQPPYAVFVKHLQSPHDKPLYRNPRLYPWLPALVSGTDPEAVEILWDEVPTRGEQEQRLFEGGLDSKLGRAAAITEAYQQGAAGGDPVAGAQAAQQAAAQEYGITAGQSPSAADPGPPPETPSHPEVEPSSVTADSVAEEQAAMLKDLPFGMGELAARKIRAATEHLPEAQREQYLEMLHAAAASTETGAPEATPPPAVPPPAELPAEARHAAEALAAQLKTMPPPMRGMAVDQTRAGLEALPPGVREQYLELYRSLGIPV